MTALGIVLVTLGGLTALGLGVLFAAAWLSERHHSGDGLANAAEELEEALAFGQWERDLWNDRGGWRFTCQNCGAVGPDRATGVEAVADAVDHGHALTEYRETAGGES